MRSRPRVVAVVTATSALLAPPASANSSDAFGPIENPLEVEVRYSELDSAIPDIVAVSAAPRVVSDAGSGVFALSPDSVVVRDELGAGVPPEAPFLYAAGAESRCYVGGEPDVPMINSGNFLRRYYNWSGVFGSAPTGWEGAWFAQYYEGGAWIYPDQPASSHPGQLVLRDAMVGHDPVLHSSECGTDAEAGHLDFHSVTLSAEGGDVTYEGGDRLGRVDLPMREGWAGSIFGWFDPPSHPIAVDLDFVAGQDLVMRASVFAKRGGTWRESVSTPRGRSWQWRFHGFNVFESPVDLEQSSAQASPNARTEGSLNVLPGMTVAALLPDGDGVRKEVLVAPGFGTARLGREGVEFTDMVRPPTAMQVPGGRTARSGSSGASEGGFYDYCTYSIDDDVPEGNVCLSLGTDGAGAVALTEVSLGADRDLADIGLPYLELDGTRFTLTPETLVEQPIALEYQFGDVDAAATPLTVLYLLSDHQVDGARFTVYWLALDYPGTYGRVLWPALVDVHTAAYSDAGPVWYVRPTLGEPLRTRIAEGITGQRIPVAVTVPTSGGFLFSGDYYRASNDGSTARLVFDPTGVGYKPSGLAWVSYDSRSTFLNWTGAPSPTPTLDVADQPVLGDDVGIYKEDFIESSFGSRLHDQALGPYGMAFGYGPFGLAPS